MCGIAGFVGLSLPESDASERIRAMCDAIRHRGPDDCGYLVAEGLALGMRRLSIIDVAGGRQPISNEDGSITVVFNGEIYNHHALREKLKAGGYRFRSKSDTEVLVHLYEDLGVNMVTELQGMFAFAIWDERDRSLFVARDRTGMKPLSYMLFPQGLVFCSELRSLLAFQDKTPAISGASVMQYLAFGYVPDPSSIFEGVKKLPPGHYLRWTSGSGATVKRFWEAPKPTSPDLPESALVDLLIGKLDKAVSSHLESEVPLGAFLSGGLDSSTVVSLMTKHAQGRVRTFSIGFEDPRYDESEAAKSVANILGTDHTDLILRPNVEDTLEAIALMFDEPFGDSSAIPTFFVAQLARESVKVALSGDGGDELFGGYTRYSKILHHGSGPGWFGEILAIIGLALPHIMPGRNRLIDMGRSEWGRYLAQVAVPVRLDEGGVARPDVPGGSVKIEDRVAGILDDALGEDIAARMMRFDLETYLPGDILTKVDRTSMAMSLEARVPLLDNDLVDFSFQLPGFMHVNKFGGKQLFRQAIRGIIPDELLSRPKKGFSIPLRSWFRGPLRHRIEALRTLSPGLRDFVDEAAVRRLVSEHSFGRRDHSHKLWRLVVLDCWIAALNDGRLQRSPSLPTLPIV